MNTGAQKRGPRLFAHVFYGKAWQEVDLIAPMSEKRQKQVAKQICQQFGGVTTTKSDRTLRLAEDHQKLQKPRRHKINLSADY